MAQEFQLNANSYIADKAAGITKFVKINGQLFYTSRQFDPRTGHPMPLNVALSPESLKDFQRNLESKIKSDQDALAGVKQMLIDMETAQELL